VSNLERKNIKDTVSIRVDGNNLSDYVSAYSYREEVTIDVPLEGDFVEAIESLTFVLWDRKDDSGIHGFSYQLSFDEKTETFSIKHTGQESVFKAISKK
jgi:hypothetical protein